MDLGIIEWFRRSGRDLPWRGTTDPWGLLVAEVMSQQTQIERVARAWAPFLERFPTPSALAEASVADLITAWGDLGFQRRALSLRKAAAIITAAGWPDDLTRLPGVGPYTAAALGSTAFGHRLPAIDTNLRRVLSRWAGRLLSPTELATYAADLVPEDAGSWNQALMDLGAIHCRPRDPHCEDCPAATWCSDPTVYQPPPRQSRFEGSVRQARAAILKTLSSQGPISADEITAMTGLRRENVDAALGSLSAEGVVATIDHTWFLDEE